MDTAVAALEAGRRAGWAKAYRLEAELAAVRAELERAKQESLDRMRLSVFSDGVLAVLAPSLAPWLNGPAPGVSTYLFPSGPRVETGSDYLGHFYLACATDDREALQAAGSAAARRWLTMPAHETDPLDRRAVEHAAWYHEAMKP